MKLAVEMENNNSYSHVHREGCKDLKDPEPIGEHINIATIANLFVSDFGWEIDIPEKDIHLAPCVKF